MATLEDIKVILNSLDTTQLTIIVALTGLVLVLLIFIAFKRGSSEEQMAFIREEKNPRSMKPELTMRLNQAVADDFNNVPESKSTVDNPKIVENQPPAVNKSEVRTQSTTQTTEPPPIPQDSVLKRHYLADEAAKEAALHEPYPTDSVLRRHYDASHKIVLEDIASTMQQAQLESNLTPATEKEEIGQVPEDSVLRRHYLANESARETQLHEPYPTDSVLRRHYDASHKIVAEAAAEITNPVGREQKGNSLKASIIEQAVDKVSPASARNKLASFMGHETLNPAAKTAIPQDSVLKRHFISQLRAEIEASMAAKPSDSVLRRHYDSLLSTELEKRLSS